MSFPLGWNSIDDATWWHDVFWWLRIACLVLLAVSEIAAKRYGDRKDELIAAAADQQVQEQRTEEGQRAAEAEALQKKLSDAEQRTAQVEADLAKAREERLPRSLTRDQQEKLITLLTPAPKGIVVVSPAIADSFDARSFASQIIDVLTRSGFTPTEAQGNTNVFISFSRPGAFLYVKDIDHAPLHARPIQNAFKSVGIFLEGFSRPEMTPDTLVIAISSHP